jgi:uncharacterized MAPEG superfamily protein
MPNIIDPYGPVFAAWLCLAAACLVQAIVADVAGIRSQHVPGMPVAGGHDDFLFRATRAQANTNESLALFVLLSLAAVLLGANVWWTNCLVWMFAVARVAHMLAYYADQRAFRSVAFGVGFLGLVGLLVVGLASLA